MLGGYSREASRPRFEKRIAHYDNVFVPEDRQPFLMVDIKPDEIARLVPASKDMTPADLVRKRCVGCHVLDRVRNYPRSNWETLVKQMAVYGMKLNEEERGKIVAHLKSGEPY